MENTPQVELETPTNNVAVGAAKEAADAGIDAAKQALSPEDKAEILQEQQDAVEERELTLESQEENLEKSLVAAERYLSREEMERIKAIRAIPEKSDRIEATAGLLRDIAKNHRLEVMSAALEDGVVTDDEADAIAESLRGKDNVEFGDKEESGSIFSEKETVKTLDRDEGGESSDFDPELGKDDSIFRQMPEKQYELDQNQSDIGTDLEGRGPSNVTSIYERLADGEKQEIEQALLRELPENVKLDGRVESIDGRDAYVGNIVYPDGGTSRIAVSISSLEGASMSGLSGEGPSPETVEDSSEQAQSGNILSIGQYRQAS